MGKNLPVGKWALVARLAQRQGVSLIIGYVPATYQNALVHLILNPISHLDDEESEAQG